MLNREVKKIEEASYTFTIYQESKNKWYANAETHDGFFIHKWTTGRTKKAVLNTIDSFLN